MQVIAKKLSVLIFVFLPFFLAAQSVNLFQGEKHSQLLRRLEIQMQNCSLCNLTFNHPVDRNVAVRIGLYADSLSKGGKLFLDKIQKEQLRQLYIGNAEWVPGGVDTFLSMNVNRKKFFQNPTSF